MKKVLNLTEVSEKIIKIFLSGHYTLKDASGMYKSSKQWNHRTVAYYFYRFIKYGWMDEKINTKLVHKKSKTGKFFKSSVVIEEYQLDFEFYFFLKLDKSKLKISNRLKLLLLNFLGKHYVRDYIHGSSEPLLERIDQLMYYLYILSDSSIDQKKQIKDFEKKFRIKLKTKNNNCVHKDVFDSNYERVDEIHNGIDDDRGAWAMTWFYAMHIRKNYSKERNELLKLISGFQDYNSLMQVP